MVKRPWWALAVSPKSGDSSQREGRRWRGACRSTERGDTSATTTALQGEFKDRRAWTRKVGTGCGSEFLLGPFFARDKRLS